MLIRLAGMTLAAKADAVSSVVRAHADVLPRSLAVIVPGTVRIRPQTV
jgi:hypothetical protein